MNTRRGFHFVLLVRVANVALFWICLSEAEARTQEKCPSVNIVLVHGFLNTGKIFDPMIRVLEGNGYRCLAPSLRPNDCRHGVRELTLKLSDTIDAHFGKSQPIFLIGFSMGGLITRDYVQNIADRKRIKGVFLIATFHHGTLWASISPGGGVKEISFNSLFVQTLNKDEKGWKGIPVCSYRAPYDLIILPIRSSLWNVGTTKKIACPIHPWMVKDKAVIADIAAQIAEFTSHM